jgi:hypothetical protein
MRPITAVRWLNDGKTIRAWKPNQGTVLMNGTEWRPFLPTPPFAEYTSGHSTFSNAAAQVLRSFTGSDSFSFSATVAQGSIPSSIESGMPTTSVTLSWPTFTAMAESASLSRQIGGIHFQDGDLHARATGTTTGNTAYSKPRATSRKPPDQHLQEPRRDLPWKSDPALHLHTSLKEAPSILPGRGGGPT